MFLDQYSVVTLEYHYYQNNCTYTELELCEEHLNGSGKLVDEDDEEVDHLLGTHDYNKDEYKIHPMSAFDRNTNNLLNYSDSHLDIVKHQRSLQASEREFFTVDETGAKVKSKL
jgi:hypothetical protein